MQRLFSFFIGIFILGLVIYSQADSFDRIIETQVEADWKWIIASFILFFIHGVTIYISWHRSLSFYDIKLRLKDTSPIHFISLISRYLPGGIWHLAGRLVAIKRKGFDGKKVLSTLFHEQLIAIIACLSLVVFFFLIQPSIYSGLINTSVKTWMLLASIPLFIFILFPRILTITLNSILKLLKKTSIPPLKRAQYYQLFFYHLLSMLFFIGAYYFSARVYISNPDMILLSGVIMLATFIGFIAIFVPSGLGIREGIFIAYLTLQGIDGGTAISIALLPRLLTISAELFSVFGAIWLTSSNDKS